MNIIDISIFNQDYECDLAYLKLILENEYVDEFVWCENEYDYRGRYKGPILEKMVAGDKFSPYRNKIKIITVSRDFSHGNKNLENERDPVQFHNAEQFLRCAPHDYINGKYSDDDRLIISDIDEVVDFTDSGRRDKIFSCFKNYGSDPLQLDRFRYSFDYDIRSYRDEMDMTTPIFTVSNLRSGAVSLSDKKWKGHCITNGDNPCVFEYCCCFSYEGILKKFHSSLHTQWVNDKIDISLKTATWTMTGYQEINKGYRPHWFERVVLTEHNSPKYVRDNFKKLSTGLVPATEVYIQNRIKYFGVNPF